jgi:hypothetical protein
MRATTLFLLVVTAGVLLAMFIFLEFLSGLPFD